MRKMPPQSSVLFLMEALASHSCVRVMAAQCNAVPYIEFWISLAERRWQGETYFMSIQQNAQLENDTSAMIVFMSLLLNNNINVIYECV